MKFFTVIILLTGLHSGYSQIKSKPITEFSQNHTKDGILIDVRTPEEFNNGHLKDARNVDWKGTGFKAYFDSIPKNTKMYLYCKKGGRSAKAQQALDSLGYWNVVNLKGGYDALRRD